MSTIPGVSATTEVVNRNPRGNSDALIALIGIAENAGAGVAVPQLFTTYSQAAAALGTDTTNGILIDMIYQAFNNGAKQVLAVVTATAAPVDEDAEYEAAFTAIQTYDDIDAVVIESTTESVSLLLETHCDFTATNNRFRRGYAGLAAGSPVNDYVSRASVIDNDRIFICGPNWKDSDDVELEGGITATIGAILAESEIDPARPVTGKAVKGVSGLTLQLVDSDYDTLHNGGVFTTSDRNGNSIMRYLTSATTGTDIIKEGTISKTRDFVMTRLKRKLESEFRRSKLTASTLKQIESSVLSQMNTWAGQEIVSPDTPPTVTAEKDETEPTKVNVTVTYNAVYPINFIQLNITLIL